MRLNNYNFLWSSETGSGNFTQPIICSTHNISKSHIDCLLLTLYLIYTENPYVDIPNKSISSCGCHMCDDRKESKGTRPTYSSAQEWIRQLGCHNSQGILFKGPARFVTVRWVTGLLDSYPAKRREEYFFVTHLIDFMLKPNYYWPESRCE